MVQARRKMVDAKSPEAKTSRVVEALFLYGGLGFYYANHYQMQAILLGMEGNCVARCRYILSALNEAPVIFRKPLHLVVQVYKEHAQTVIYNEEKHTVWDPLTGEVKNYIDAPLYHPHIFLHAFVKARGIKPAVSDADLLIAPADPMKPKFLAQSPQNPSETPNVKELQPLNEAQEIKTEEPKVEGSGPFRPIYDEANRKNYPPLAEGKLFAMPSYSLLAAPPPTPVRGFNLPPVYPDEIPGDDNSAWVKEVEDQELKTFYDIMFDRQTLTFEFSQEGQIIFKTNEEKQVHRALNGPQDRNAFLLNLAEKSVMDLMHAPEMKSLELLLNHPKELRNLDPKLIKESYWVLKNLNNNFNTIETFLLRYQSNASTHYFNRPNLKAFSKKLEQFSNYIKSYPSEFLDSINHASIDVAQDMTGFLVSLTYLRTHTGVSREDADQSILPMLNLLNKSNLVVEHPLKLEEDAETKSKTDWEATSSSSQGPPTAQETPSKSSKSAPANPQDVYPEVMIPMLIRFGDLQMDNGHFLMERWTPELSRRFLELNREGRYNQEYLINFSRHSTPEMQQAAKHFLEVKKSLPLK